MNNLHLTLDELKQNDFTSACGIYPFIPSLSYIISTYYKDINIFQKGNNITVDGELQKPIFEFFEKKCDLTKKKHKIIFSFENEKKLNNDINILKFSKGHILPKPKKNELYLYYKDEDKDLGFEIAILKQYFKRIFPDNPFTVRYTTTYSFDFNKFKVLDFKINEGLFWQKMFLEIHGETFKVSINFKTISFDFKTEDELNKKLNVIRAIPEIEIYDRKEFQRFKMTNFERNLLNNFNN